MNKVTGGWVPAQMWKEFMKKALAGVPAQDFKYPNGMVKRRVNWDTKLLASADTPNDARVTIEKYWIGTEPTEFDTIELIEKVKFQAKQKEEEESLVSDFFNM
jgi:membrane carboxypeptidase/penicillin-binding protein